ncbi:DUF1345 domain-containing protein [Sphingosinicellaceae bacterium]|nr:DUF1345 domain-containing protein [Sphingosinicellaceae bacterium]
MSWYRRYARFAMFFAIMIVATGALFAIGAKIVPAVLGGFDLGAIAFLGATLWALSDDEADEMRKRAAENEPDQYILQIVAAVIIVVIVTAVGFELTSGSGRSLALAGGTLLLAWLFGNVLYAIHYAHSYYLDDGKGGDCGGLEFPGEDEPVYWDFAYFSFVLGMTFQVSDVEIKRTGLRRTALIHSLIAFLFNLGVIALTVSLVGNLIK